MYHTTLKLKYHEYARVCFNIEKDLLAQNVKMNDDFRKTLLKEYKCIESQRLSNENSMVFVYSLAFKTRHDKFIFILKFM